MSKMNIGVIVFPDFDCGRTLLNSIELVANQHITPILPNSKNTLKFDTIFISGGTNWLDYIKGNEPFQPIIEAIFAYVEKGGILIGTGVGFDLLCRLKLLPGYFEKNISENFISKNVFLKVNNSNSILTCQVEKKSILKIPLSSLYGRYYASDNELIAMRQNNQIIYHYCDDEGKVSTKINYTGSIDNIASICNSKGNVFGIYPRPELASNKILGNCDGLSILKSVFSWNNRKY